MVKRMVLSCEVGKTNKFGIFHLVSLPNVMKYDIVSQRTRGENLHMRKIIKKAELCNKISMF